MFLKHNNYGGELVKITKSQLKQIIKEELAIVTELGGEIGGGTHAGLSGLRMKGDTSLVNPYDTSRAGGAELRQSLEHDPGLLKDLMDLQQKIDVSSAGLENFFNINPLSDNVTAGRLMSTLEELKELLADIDKKK